MNPRAGPIVNLLADGPLLPRRLRLFMGLLLCLCLSAQGTVTATQPAVVVYRPSAEVAVRGALIQIDERRSTVTVRDESGQTRTLPLSPATMFLTGLRRLPTDLSLLPTYVSAGATVVVTLVSDRVAVIEPEYRWHAYPALWVEDLVYDIKHWSLTSLGPDALLSNEANVLALISVSLTCLLCGLVSSLVVTNRMAFFSDALAHCAFAGVALGYILLFMDWFTSDDGVLLCMVLFGAGMGVLIAYVRDQTTLAIDTVIGVFFAGAMGLGAVLLKAMSSLGSRSSPENFLFGDPLAVGGRHVVLLATVLLLTVGFLLRQYNRMVFASFNASLARARRVRVKLGNYLFIVLLAIVVNISLKMVGALLINALLILPAATAGNLARNLRQFFWYTAVLALTMGIGGFVLSVGWTPTLGGRPVHLVSGGVIVLLGVSLFCVSIVVGRWVRGPRAVVRPG